MKHMEYLHNSPILGIAHHKIVLDDCGTPVDYEFLEVNASFSTMTGLQHKNLIGKTVREAIPGIDTSGFDWIGCFGAIALNGGDKVFEEFSEPLGKWYRVHVYSTEPLYFTTVFIDITEPVLQTRRKIRMETASLVSTVSVNDRTNGRLFDNNAYNTDIRLTHTNLVSY